MKIPRDLNGSDLVAILIKKYKYRVVRQKGSHIRLTTDEPSEHHITIPNHIPLKLGTLASILSDIAEHQGLSRDELIEKLFK